VVKGPGVAERRDRFREDEVLMFSNGNSFGECANSVANGNSMELGSGNSYGMPVADGSRPASAACMFTVLVWRL
jgi:hypothetical protein